MKYVRQQLEYDCGPCALAMVTDIPREDVLRWCAPHVHNGRGITDLHVEDFLIAHGFVYQTMRRYQNAGTCRKRPRWPPVPFAPRHVVEVDATKGYHFVAMDSDGFVFDPWKAERKALSHADYKAIVMVWGVWPLLGDRPPYA